MQTREMRSLVSQEEFDRGIKLWIQFRAVMFVLLYISTLPVRPAEWRHQDTKAAGRDFCYCCTFLCFLLGHCTDSVSCPSSHLWQDRCAPYSEEHLEQWTAEVRDRCCFYNPNAPGRQGRCSSGLPCVCLGAIVLLLGVVAPSNSMAVLLTAPVGGLAGWLATAAWDLAMLPLFAIIIIMVPMRIGIDYDEPPTSVWFWIGEFIK